MAEAHHAVAAEGGEPKALASPAAMRGRGEVDTSSPFESVRQAVDLFSGGAASPWRPPQPPPLHLRPEEIELMKVEEQTVKLEMELFVKEKETFKVLSELQTTKQVIDDLKVQIEKVTPEAANGAKYTDTMKVHSLPDIEQKCGDHTKPLIQSTNRRQSPLTTLIELKQAKAYLNMDTVEVFKSQIEEEKGSLEKTRERLHLNTAKASLLEEDLNKTVAQLQALKVVKPTGPTLQPSEIWLQMKQLNSEKEKYRKVAEDSKHEISELTAVIEHTKSKMKTLQFRIVMAEKLKEAAKCGEALALAERKTPSSGQDLDSVASSVTLSLEDHSMLVHRAQEADDTSRMKIDTALQELEQANRCKLELLERVEEAMTDVETSRRALEEALQREDASNKAKTAAEETLRRLRSEQIIQNWRPINNSTKFKSTATTTRKAGSGIYDVNGMSLMTSGPTNTRTMSIGQILSMKLDQEFEAGNNRNARKKVSLGQILSQKCEVYSPLRIDDGTSRKKFPTRRKKLGLIVFALLLARQKHKKRQACYTKGNLCTKVM